MLPLGQVQHGDHLNSRNVTARVTLSLTSRDSHTVTSQSNLHVTLGVGDTVFFFNRFDTIQEMDQEMESEKEFETRNRPSRHVTVT